MNPLFGALITGGASLLGSMFSSDTSAENTQANIAMQQQTNQLNVEEAQKNRDFQTQMSNTAYQRAKQDMEAAGLNPMMMTQGSMNASSPGGAMATNVAPRSEKTSPLAGIGHAAEAAMKSALDMKQMEQMTEQTANLVTSRKQIEALTDVLSKEAYGKELANIKSGLGMPAARLESEKGQDVESVVPRGVRKAVNVAGYGSQKFDDVVAPLVSSVTGLGALKKALIGKYGNASDLEKNPTAWRRGYDAGLRENE